MNEIIQHLDLSESNLHYNRDSITFWRVIWSDPGFISGVSPFYLTSASDTQV